MDYHCQIFVIPKDECRLSNEYIKIDSLHTGPWCDCTLRHKLCVRRSIEKISTFVSTLTKIGYFK